MKTAKKASKAKTAIAVLDKKQLATAVKGQISDVSKVQALLGKISDLTMRSAPAPDESVAPGSTDALVDDLRARLNDIADLVAHGINPILKRLDKRATNIKPSLKKHLAGK